MPKIRVGIFTWDFEPVQGGIGVHASELYHVLLNDSGFEPVVFSPRQAGVPNHVEIPVPNFLDLGQVFFSLKCSLGMKKLVRQHALDLVHVLGSSGGMQLLFKPPVPSVYTLNNTYFYVFRKFPTPKFRFMKSLERRSLRNADFLTSISHGISEEINREEKHDIQTVYIGMDAQVFRPQKTKREKMVLFVGRLVKNKGVLELLEAFSQCAEKDFELWFVGEGPLLGPLQEKAVGLGIKGRVKFFPKADRPKLPEVYSKAHVLVLPSWSEGFGLVVAEAMMCGCLVLGSDIPGIQDQIEDQKTGFLFRVRDTADLTQKLDQILSARNLDSVRAAALEKARDFSLEKMVSSYKAIYTELLSK